MKRQTKNKRAVPAQRPVYTFDPKQPAVPPKAYFEIPAIGKHGYVKGIIGGFYYA